MAWLGGWGYRKQITVDHNQIDANLTGFSVLIYETLGADFVAHAKADGFDFRITESDGTTLIPYDRAFYNGGTGQLELWFPGDQSALVDSVFYIYYGNILAPDGHDADAAWAVEEKAVWHFTEAGGNRADSSGNGNTLTEHNGVAGVAGKIYKAADFVRAGNDFLDRADCLDLSAGDVDFMIWTWVNLDNKADSFSLAVKWRDVLANWREYALWYYVVNDRFRFTVSDDGTWGGGHSAVVEADVLGSPAATTWYLVFAWHDSVSNEIGIQVNEGVPDTVAWANGVHNGLSAFLVGTNAARSYYSDGLQDELHFIKAVRSKAYRDALYRNQNSPATFYTLGPEEEYHSYYWWWSQATPVVEAESYHWARLSQVVPVMEAHAYYWWLSQLEPIVEVQPDFWQLSQVLPIIEMVPTEAPPAVWERQTWTEEELEGSYSVLIRTPEGVQIALIDAYQKITYLRQLNGQGLYQLTGSPDLVDPDYFGLDHQVVVLRAPPGMDWGTDFVGLHRYEHFWHDARHQEWYNSKGPGIDQLLKRRIIVPDEGESFLTIEDEVSDIMRQLVRTQAGPLADADRQFPNLGVQADSSDGVSLRLNFRYSQLFKELENLSELGVDFGIVETDPAVFEFQAFYPQRGLDCRVGNTEGNPPVIFSLEMANMSQPSIEKNRLGEVTWTYVGGEGAGASRVIVERASLEAADLDSPFNRIESFIEARQETSVGSLMAIGDAFLAKNSRKVTFTCQAVPTPACLYGRDWDLGYLVTGYHRAVEYDLKVIAVEITVDAKGEAIKPTFLATAMRPMEEEEDEYAYWT